MSRAPPPRLLLRGPLGSPTGREGPRGPPAAPRRRCTRARGARACMPARRSPARQAILRSRAGAAGHPGQPGLGAAWSGPPGAEGLTARLATARTARTAEDARRPRERTLRAARPRLQVPGRGAGPRGAAAASEPLSTAPPPPMRGRGRPLKVNGRGRRACALGGREGGRDASEEGGRVGRASGKKGVGGWVRRGRDGARAWRGRGRAAGDARDAGGLGAARLLCCFLATTPARPPGLALATRSLPLLPHGGPGPGRRSQRLEGPGVPVVPPRTLGALIERDSRLAPPPGPATDTVPTTAREPRNRRRFHFRGERNSMPLPRHALPGPGSGPSSLKSHPPGLRHGHRRKTSVDDRKT